MVTRTRPRFLARLSRRPSWGYRSFLVTVAKRATAAVNKRLAALQDLYVWRGLDGPGHPVLAVIRARRRGGGRLVRSGAGA